MTLTLVVINIRENWNALFLNRYKEIKTMSKSSLLLFILLSAFGSPVLMAQSQADTSKLAIGQWRSLLPLNTGRYVTQSADKLFYAAEQSIIILDKTELSTEEISREDGLSNTGIRLLRYSPGAKTLIVVYNNSVIDLVPDQGPILTLNQIANFSNFVGDKIVYDVVIENNDNVLICGNYGLSRLNLQRREFSFSTFTGLDVFSAAIFNNQIYAATEGGIFRVPLSERNPQNFGNWRFLGPESGFPRDYSSRSVCMFGQQLYADVSNQVFRVEASSITPILQRPGFNIQHMSAEGKNLLVLFRCVSGGCDRGALSTINASGQRTDASNRCLGIPNNAIEDQKGRIWLGDLWREIRVLNNLSAEGCQTYTFNSPFSERVFDIAIRDKELYISHGGVSRVWGYLFRSDGFSKYEDGRWSAFTRFNSRALQGENAGNTDDDLTDILTVLPHPKNKKIYVGSYYEGLVEMEGNTYKLFNEKNSSLNNAVGDGARTRVSGLAFDKDDQLWVSNHTADRPLSVLTKDGNWKSFRPSCDITSLHQIAIDQSGNKWIASNSNSVGLVVFNEGKLDDNSDDRCRSITTANSELQTNRINCVAADLDGDVWVGTGEGIVIFECGNDAFKAECRGNRRILEVVPGFPAYLLETEDVLCIAVDGGNRKWVGTRNGVFVISPSGREQLNHFTTQNSPLLSNVILDLAIDPKTGEVYIGTESGIIVYQAEALLGERVHNIDIQVYPNPVAPNYEGPIAIRGLARDAVVKITDVSGQLVYETRALGGQAIWDGRDYQGQRVRSGVYLVLSTSNPRDAGFGKPDRGTTKIVVLGEGKK
jgi:hypothetical protein